MTELEKYKLAYEYQRGGYKDYPTFEEWMEKPESKYTSNEEFENEVALAVIAKERTDLYKKMVQENSYVLMNNGITEEEIEHILSNQIISTNMEGEIEKLLFIIETLKVFNIYNPDIKINDIKTLGGGFYEDGYIYGYNINIDNNDKYRIEFGRFSDEAETDTNRLIFEPTNNKELMTKEVEMLKKFSGFYNNDSLLETIKNLEVALNKKMHI